MSIQVESGSQLHGSVQEPHRFWPGLQRNAPVAVSCCIEQFSVPKFLDMLMVTMRLQMNDMFYMNV